MQCSTIQTHLKSIHYSAVQYSTVCQVYVSLTPEYHSGNWSVLVRPTETLIVRAGFEVGQLGSHPRGETQLACRQCPKVPPTPIRLSVVHFTYIQVVVEASPTTTTSTTIEATTPMPEDVAPIFSVSATNDVPISIEVCPRFNDWKSC